MEPMIGHKAIWDYLTQAADAGTLAHAFLFVGPRHVGKGHLASTFASYWLCDPQSPASSLFAAETNAATPSKPCGTCRNCRSFAQGMHPDVLTLSLPEDKHQISISLMRTFLSSLSQSPALASKKIGIIDGGEFLSNAAANAFLKTLEEASSSTTLIVIAHDPQRLLPTVKSRCQIIEFGRVLKADASINDQPQWRAARGLPGLYKRALKHELSEAEDYEQFIQFFDMTPGQRLASIESFFAGKGAHAPKKQEWVNRLAVWQSATRDMMCSQLGLTESLPSRPQAYPQPFAACQGYQRVIDDLARIRRDIGGNINIRAHLEAMLLNLSVHT
jgi:hypothetical protein